jgi:hypothetical protein
VPIRLSPPDRESALTLGRTLSAIKGACMKPKWNGQTARHRALQLSP